MRWATAVIVSAIVLAGCGSSPSSSSADADGRVEVVASFYPVAYAAQRVGGSSVRVFDLTPAGVEPHDLEITTRQVDRMEDADLVLYVGGGFQPAVEDVAKRWVDDPVDVRPASVRGSDDPHFWLDPIAYRESVDVIARALASRGVDGVAARRRAFADELTALDRDMRATLSTCDRTTIVASHAAFDHLARRYGLREEPITGLSPESEPDAGRMAALASLVKRTGTTTIFTEELVSPRVANALAREAGVRTAVLNPLEGLSASERRAGDDYVSVMHRNLATLASALGCRAS
jgi:zinc transport system substrate-binding protein